MASAISRLFASAAALLLLGLAACSPVPDAETLRATVKARLAAAFAEPVLEIETFRRLGSGPLPQGDDGVERRIVYYNATLRLAADHAFADWEALNAAALAELLGAADRGLEGVRPEGNVRGDLLHVRGSATFAHTPEGWRAAPFAAPPPPTAPPTDNTGPPALARSLIERISALFDDPPGRETEARAIITEELVDAHRKIDLRLERLQRAFVIAGGPGGGEYDLVARSIAAASSAAGIRAVAVATQGSVENVRLLREG
ncbi:MAG: C4-dicarboxylate ABC transporter substrate-binding protein, partial [Alphaproteobacteria bacterium]